MNSEGQRIDHAHEERQTLASEILALIETGPDGDVAAFEGLAMRIFEHQYAANEPYKAFCDAKGLTPATVLSWRDIPAFPTEAFKRDVVTSFPAEEAVMAQLTSGTMSPNQRGRIFRDEIGRSLVFTANRVMTGAYLFPDLGAGQRCRILLLAPSPEMAPSMGMAIGMEQSRQHFGSPESAFLLGRSGIDVKALVDALRVSEETGEPVALIGATSAFVFFLRACERRRMRFRLPAGSRVCDGGGYRGRFGDLTREDYYALAADRLGLPSSHCVNTLGMAESATNYFDDVLRRCVLGGEQAPRSKPAPPWTRVEAMSVDSLEPLPPGEVGLLRHYDLANLPTVLAVQTDNLGATDGRGGFEIVGRARIVDGRVSEAPGERTVGPMGDRRVFRMLESYVNFSIDFKMRGVTARTDEPPAGEVPSCPVVVDDIVAGAEDDAARKRAERALAAYGEGPEKAESSQAAAERQDADRAPE